jgi:uncharacterized protein (TIGR02246 family)
MTTDAQAIRDLIASWARASEAGDYNTLESLMHPDVVFLTVGNEPIRREAFRESFLHVVKTMRIQCKADVREVEVSGDLAYAWIWLEVHIKSEASDVRAERKGNVLSVYKRNDEGQWQIWRDANLIVS